MSLASMISDAKCLWLQVIAVYTSQTALFKTLNLFPPEKQLVQTERAKGSYSVLPYFLSKVLAELPTLAVYPLVHSAIVYPMTGLQPGVRGGLACVGLLLLYSLLRCNGVCTA